MATRCTIRIEGMKPVIYKHWDGSPESTLPWLQEFNKRFTEARGNDESYKFAQLLRDSVFNQATFNLDDSKTTGWGVFDEQTDCGQEFDYLLCADGSVKAYSGYGLKMKLLKAGAK